MATYYRGMRLHPADTKYIVHPHYATQADASNEAIGHQVRTFNSLFSLCHHFFFCYVRILVLLLRHFFSDILEEKRNEKKHY